MCVCARARVKLYKSHSTERVTFLSSGHFMYKKCMEINSKIHFIINQNFLHIKLTTN